MDSSGSRQGQMSESVEYANDPSSTMKCEEILSIRRNISACSPLKEIRKRTIFPKQCNPPTECNKHAEEGETHFTVLQEQ